MELGIRFLNNSLNLKLKRFFKTNSIEKVIDTYVQKTKHEITFSVFLNHI